MTLRVCIVQPVVPPYRTGLFNALGRSSDIDLTVWASQRAPGSPDGDDPRRFDGFAFEEAPVRRIGPLFSQPRQLRTAKGPFDVVVFGWNIRYVELVPSLLLTRHAGMGSVVWGHGTSRRENKIRRTARERVGARADAILVYNESIASSVRERIPSPARVFAAANTIDLSGIQEARAQWLNQPDRLQMFRRGQALGDSTLLLYVSRLRPGKRAEVLLRAAASLVRESRDVRVALIGEGPSRPELEAEAERLGIADRVIFVGAVFNEVDLAPWFLSAEACVIPSAIGLTALHSFGYGVPIVTSREDAGPEIDAIRDGENGILVEPGDHAALADALRSLLDHPRRLAKLSAGAMQTATDSPFTFARMLGGMRDAIIFAAGVSKRRVSTS